MNHLDQPEGVAPAATLPDEEELRDGVLFVGEFGHTLITTDTYSQIGGEAWVSVRNPDDVNGVEMPLFEGMASQFAARHTLGRYDVRWTV